MDKDKPKAPKKSTVFRKPTLEEVQAYCEDRDNGIDPGAFIDYYEANGWRVGRTGMKDWKAAVRTWERNNVKRGGGEKTDRAFEDFDRYVEEQERRAEQCD